jgi:PEGA domain
MQRPWGGLLVVVGTLIVSFSASLWVLAFAADSKKVAVLELVNKAGITDDEAYFLTDKVRRMASGTLPAAHFTIMTSENIQELLPPGKDLAKCTDAQCEVEIGRNIGAEYIITGEIIRYAGDLRVQVKVHHVPSGHFIGSMDTEPGGLREQESMLSAISATMMNKVLSHSGSGPASPGGTTIQPGSIGESSTGGWELPSTSQTVVRFESDPAGAVVMVDGRLKCQQTPCGKAMNEGSATVSMQRERYQARQEIVQIKQGMSPISWKLTPNFGWLSVESSPSGFLVKINGESAGTTPLQNKELDPGSYEVLVTDPRYYDQGERFTLTTGEHKAVSVTLPPREGGIHVIAKDRLGNDVTGELFIDGQKIGAVPRTHKTVVGSHRIDVKSIHGNWTSDVDVNERQVTSVIAEVIPSSPKSTNTSSGRQRLKKVERSFVLEDIDPMFVSLRGTSNDPFQRDSYKYTTFGDSEIDTYLSASHKIHALLLCCNSYLIHLYSAVDVADTKAELDALMSNAERINRLLAPLLPEATKLSAFGALLYNSSVRKFKTNPINLKYLPSLARDLKESSGYLQQAKNDIKVLQDKTSVLISEIDSKATSR